jgi:hypothetical protein
MSMSMNLHTKIAENFEVKAKLTTADLHTGEKYPVIQISSTPKGSWDFQEVTLFPSFEQVKQLHQELTNLMKKIEELENVPTEDKTELPL